MHEVLSDIGLLKYRVDNLESLRKEVKMIWTRVVTRKHGMEDLMLVLKYAEIKVESIPAHIHQGQAATKYQEERGEKTILVVHLG